MIHFLLPLASILVISGILFLFELRLNVQRERKRAEFRRRQAAYYRNQRR